MQAKQPSKHKNRPPTASEAYSRSGFRPSEMPGFEPLDRGMLPLGVQTFSEVRSSGDYYVDKTAYAHRMATEGKCYFLSRPRRFGKSLFVSMLKELFEGNEKLFEGLLIHDQWDWNVSRPVLHLSFGSGHFTIPGGLHEDLSARMQDAESEAGITSNTSALPARLRRLLAELHRRSGRRAVVLIDEYDKPILDAIEDSDPARANRDFPRGEQDLTDRQVGHENPARANRDFLRGFYAMRSKFSDEHLRFVFLTGVSKFSKVSLFSGLNNLQDITLNPAYSTVCGFTETDLDRVFTPELEGLDRDLIREWYNGYSWLGTEKVYNPYDVLMLLHEREFRPHWFETASPTFLINTLIKQRVPTPSLTGTVSRDRLLSSFDVDHIGTEALLFQTGYLTITAAKQNGIHTLYELDYPNLEVRHSLNTALLQKLTGPETSHTATTSNLPNLLLQGDTQGLRELFECFFSSIPHQWHTTNHAAQYESYYSSIFYTYFTACGIDTRVEDTTNRGRIDMTAITPQHIWIFEFKTTKHTPTGTALQQIHDRGYPDKYRTHNLPIILVGIEFNPETRNITSFQTTTT